MSGKPDELSLTSRLVIGGIAGFVATLAMTRAMRRLHRRLPAAERYPLTPREITDRALAPPRATAPEVTLAVHFLYGAGCGALLAAANPRMGRLTGALAGTGVWLASYLGWIPAVGLLKPATRHPGRRNLLMLRVHFTWGWATAAAMQELVRARGTVFAAGPALDAPGRVSPAEPQSSA